MFSHRLRQLRLEWGMTQAALAKHLGVSQGTVGNWEGGKREPDFTTVARLAALFGTTADDLIGNPPTKAETKLILLARKAEHIPEQERENILRVFEDTIDIYLKAKGLDK